MKKFIIPLLLLSIILTGCTNTKTMVPQACTEEAKVCPDGSAVGRTQPNCEFAPCPRVDIPAVSTGAEVPSSPQACTMEAKLCSDGSAVGRSGPNCEFAPCPAEAQAPCVPTCSCPAGYRQEGESCNPECYYSTPKCLAPSRQCQPTNNCVQNK